MDEHMDLSALELSVTQRERLVAEIMRRATAELERRANADVSPIILMSQWARPALAAAAVLAIICVSVLAQHDFKGAQIARGVTERLNVPAPANEWVGADRAPTLDDVLLAMETEGR